MKSNATFNTAFIALSERDIEPFLDVSFRALKRKAEEIIKTPGTYSIIIDIIAEPFNQDKEQEMTLQEVA